MATVVSDPFLGFRGQRNSTNGWFNMPFPNYSSLSFNNSGGGMLGTINGDVYFVPNGATSSYNSCSTASYRLIWNNSTYQNIKSSIGLPLNTIIPELPNTTDDFILVFPADLVANYYYVKVNKPEFLSADSTCSTLTYSTAFPVYEYEQAEAGSGSSCDISPLVPAILMIPATLIVLATFSIIYKMFMNRKVRG